mgnify:CR=1 FL=1
MQYWCLRFDKEELLVASVMRRVCNDLCIVFIAGVLDVKYIAGSIIENAKAAIGADFYNPFLCGNIEGVIKVKNFILGRIAIKRILGIENRCDTIHNRSGIMIIEKRREVPKLPIGNFGVGEILIHHNIDAFCRSRSIGQKFSVGTLDFISTGDVALSGCCIYITAANPSATV